MFKNKQCGLKTTTNGTQSVKKVEGGRGINGCYEKEKEKQR